MKLTIPFLFGLLLLFGLQWVWVRSEGVTASPVPVTEKSQNAPSPSSVMFIENVGQFGVGALFQSEWSGGTLFVAKEALWLSYFEPLPMEWSQIDPVTGATIEPPIRGGVHLKLTLVGANPHATIESFMPLTATANYFYGNNPAHWRTKVPQWGGVRYREIYPGVDLELAGVEGQLVPRFIVQDGHEAEIAQIQLQVEGAEQLRFEEGKLIAVTERGSYALPLFQMVTADGIEVTNLSPKIEGNRVLSPFIANTTAPVTHKPMSELLPSNLRYATYLGGDGYDFGSKIARDAQGAIYIGGYTESFDFPTTPGAFDPIPSPSQYRRQAFVTKLNPSGTTLDYSTFIDGNDSDYVYGLAVDGESALYMAGETRSSNFPTTPNAPTPSFGGGVDGYVLKLSPSGAQLLYGMYLGGSEQDYARDMALGADGTVVVMGRTLSGNFPVTPNAYDTQRNDFDMFVTRVSVDGLSLVYSTFLGSVLSEFAFGVAVDSANSAYVLGRTDGADYPTTPGALDTTPIKGNLVVTKLTPAGDDLIYSTAISGYSGFTGGAMAVDATGAAYFTGEADRTGFPVTAGAYDTICGTEGYPCNAAQRSDGILIKLNPAGSEVVYGTYFGGALEDRGGDIIVDTTGNVYVAGRAESPDLNLTPGGHSVDPTLNMMPFALYKFNATGSEVLHLVRSPGLSSAGIALEAEDVLWITGSVEPNYFTFHPTEGAYDTTYAGALDASAVRLLLTKAATATEIPMMGGSTFSTSDRITVTYTFAANPFTETAVFTHAPRHPISLPPVAPFVTVGDPFVNYAIGSDGQTPLQPLQPYTIDIYYNPADLGGQGSVLGLYYWDGNAWLSEPSTLIDPTTHHLLATPCRFGWWAILRHPNQLYLPSIRR